LRSCGLRYAGACWRGMASCLRASALVLLGWAVSILVGGIPEGNFSWGGGFLSATVGWAFYVLRRFTLPKRVRTHGLGYYVHVLAFASALPVDLGVAFLMAVRVSKQFHGI
jgi:hypothetical protein